MKSTTTKKNFVKPSRSFIPFPVTEPSVFLLPRHYQGQQSFCQEGVVAFPAWLQALTALEETSLGMPRGPTSKPRAVQALLNLPAEFHPPMKSSARCLCPSALLRVSFELCLGSFEQVCFSPSLPLPVAQQGLEPPQGGNCPWALVVGRKFTSPHLVGQPVRICSPGFLKDSLQDTDFNVHASSDRDLMRVLQSSF